MKLEIKDFYSPDIDSIWQWHPSRVEDVHFLLELNIGEIGSEASDVFQVFVATPEGLRASESSDAGVVFSSRATIVLKEYSWESLLNEIGKIVNSCAGTDWVESTLKLQRYFHWEYEDYVVDDLYYKGSKE